MLVVLIFLCFIGAIYVDNWVVRLVLCAFGVYLFTVRAKEMKKKNEEDRKE